MHLYWRIQADLDEIGSRLFLKHPNLSREFEKWVRRNAGGLEISEDLTWNTMERCRLSPSRV